MNMPKHIARNASSRSGSTRSTSGAVTDAGPGNVVVPASAMGGPRRLFSGWLSSEQAPRRYPAWY